jgi:hypothetical protein
MALRDHDVVKIGVAAQVREFRVQRAHNRSTLLRNKNNRRPRMQEHLEIALVVALSGEISDLLHALVEPDQLRKVRRPAFSYRHHQRSSFFFSNTINKHGYDAYKPYLLGKKEYYLRFRHRIAPADIEFIENRKH